LGAIAFIQKSGEKLMTKRLTDEEILKQLERVYEQGTRSLDWQLWHIEIVEAAKIAEQKAKEMSELATAITQKYQKRLLDFMQTSTEKQEE
jgi:hypothetical protein